MLVFSLSSETCPVTERVLAILTSYNRRMFRYMVGVFWKDRLSSEEVAGICVVDVIEHVLRRRRLRWYGHVKRNHESDPLTKVTNLNVAGRRPPGRPRKSWRRTVEEDMRVVGAQEEDALDQARWRCIIKR